MNYKVMTHSYINSGGNCMVSVFEVWLPDENRTVYVNVGEGYSTITTVNYIENDLDIDDYDAITIDVMVYHYADTSSKYFELHRYCLFEYLKKDCKHMKYKESLPFCWLPSAYQNQISDEQQKYVSLEYCDEYMTDGYSVWMPTGRGMYEIKIVCGLQHNSLQETLAACLDRLQSTYECNREAMDADDIGDLLTTIEDVKYYMD